jgi:hypothetical protein
MPKVDETPVMLQPYLFHRLELRWSGNEDAIGACPFCTGENKFFVNPTTGQYHCKTCSGGPKAGKNGGGNIYNFMRGLHEESIGTTSLPELELVAEERRVPVAARSRWGLVQSCIDREWMLPAYGPKNEVNQLYRWSKLGDKRRLLATKTLDHCLFGTQFGFYTDRKPVYILEGPWDAVAFEEQCLAYMLSSLTKTFVKCFPEDSFRTQIHILGVPGCETFRDDWLPYFQGREVFLLYDNDHPRINKKTGKEIPSAGLSGMKMAARKLRDIAKVVNYLHWDDKGYNEELPSGYDVRDYLTL